MANSKSDKNAKNQPKADKKGSVAKGKVDRAALARMAENDPELMKALEQEAQKRISVLGFALLGLMMGFLWGANAPVHVEETAVPVLQALRTGLGVAVSSPDWYRGMLMGVPGAVLGGAFGLSIFFTRVKMANPTKA